LVLHFKAAVKLKPALRKNAWQVVLPFIFCWSEGFGLSRQLVPSDSEGNNCASEATQILQLNNEQNLRTLILMTAQILCSYNNCFLF
jgi:hypothetical protein